MRKPLDRYHQQHPPPNHHHHKMKTGISNSSGASRKINKRTVGQINQEFNQHHRHRPDGVPHHHHRTKVDGVGAKPNRSVNNQMLLLSLITSRYYEIPIVIYSTEL